MSGILSPKPALALFAVCLSIHSLSLRDAAIAAEERPGGAVAEIQPFEIPPGEVPRRVFEQWRAHVPGAAADTLALEMLAIPAREKSSMVRVAGMLVAPVTGDYAFTIHAPEQHKFEAPDDVELWIQDGRGGEWRLAQRTGNPNKRSGRTRLEAGVPRRFELWTMGSRAVSVDWEVRDFENKDPVDGGARVILARETVPVSAMRLRTPAPDDRHGDGLRDSWKKRHGLDPDGATGPDGPWGDPDGDGLLNWQEQLAGADPLKADTEGRDGLVRWEIWRDIPGRYVFDLRRATVFPTGPREVRHLDRLEIPTGNGNRYGSRVRGFLKPPADGEYTFKIIADDNAELWLGESDSWQSKRLIAKAGQPGSARLTWTRRGEGGVILPLHAEQIARVTLKAGRSYYLEILHKQDTSQDHCAVAWVRPGEDAPELIGAEFLASWQPAADDSDDDGLPDEWQRTVGLADAAADPALRHAEADPDRDGAPNREEWLAGTDPLSAAEAPESGGMLTSEAWTDIPGHRIAELTSDPRFPARPDFTTRIDNLDFDREGENYGVRLRGYLTAPDDGSYHFAISGNNACLLYLGESEDKFTKRVIARVEHGTDWRFFAAAPQQRGGPVELQAGRRYYIEVLFKRGPDETGRADHSSVAWTRPGRLESVIAPEFFSPYRPDPRDLDDDDLPDDWEILHGLDPADPAGSHGAWGDPDTDGLENFREFRLGLDPATGDVHGTPGLALWEYWDDREDLMPALRDEGGRLSERLRQDPRFPLVPVRREWRESLEAPRGVDVNYASRMRAVIVAPETGDYVFAVSSHHASELFLSPDESKFNRQSIASIAWASRYREWDNHATQISAPVRLEAGARHYIEAFHAQGRNPLRRDHLCVAWKLPGSESFEVIGGEHLIAFFRDTDDLDDDDLPDDWERANGLPVDGITGDGDFDGDGLADREEYRLGTRADLADTDGDGVNDHDEIHVYGSNPQVKDAEAPLKLSDLDPYTAVSLSGDWRANDEGGLIGIERRGVADYAFSISDAGILKVEIDAIALTSRDYTPPVPLVVSIDGMLLGRIDVPGRGVMGSWVTPWLPSGDHVLRLDNRNGVEGTLLGIRRVSLFRHVGEDADGNAVPDWMDAYYSRNSTVDAPVERSIVSPVSLEGSANHPSEIAVAVGGEQVEVAEALTGRWYSNVPLDCDGPTAVSVGFVGGAYHTEVEIVWEALNLFDQEGPLNLRTGDSLKVTAIPSGSDGANGSLRVDGEVVFTGGLTTGTVITFDKPGPHTVSAVVDGGAGQSDASVEVVAHAADFGRAFSVANGTSRPWSLPDVPVELTLTADPNLELEEMSTVTPREVLVTSHKDPSDFRRVVARLPGSGSIVAATQVNTFRIIDAAEGLDAVMVNVLPDGTRVIVIGIAIDGVIPPDLSIWLQMYVTDAVFANGDTYFHLTAEDFDEFGVAKVTIYKAPGGSIAAVCHIIKPYGDDPNAEPEEEPQSDPQAE